MAYQEKIPTGINAYPHMSITPRGEIRLIGDDIHPDIFLTPKKAARFRKALDEGIKQSARYEIRNDALAIARMSPYEAAVLLSEHRNKDTRKGLKRAAANKSIGRTQEDILLQFSLIDSQGAVTEKGHAIVEQLNILARQRAQTALSEALEIASNVTTATKKKLAR